MNNLLLNPITEKQLNSYIGRPSTALLIDTQGDLFVSKHLIEYLNDKIVGSNQPILAVNPEKNIIGIEKIRELQHSLSLSANKSSNDVSRLAVIYGANLLTNEAQSSLLKLMEELPKRTVLILTADNSENLLGTVLSRCFTVKVLPVNSDEANLFASKLGYSSKSIQKAYKFSEGKPGELINLLEEGMEEFEQSIGLAKQFIAYTIIDKQKTAQTLAKDKDAVSRFMYSLELISKTALRSAGDYQSKKRWQHIYKATLTAKNRLKNNVSSKLVLLSLSLEI